MRRSSTDKARDIEKPQHSFPSNRCPSNIFLVVSTGVEDAFDFGEFDNMECVSAPLMVDDI